MKWFHDLGVTGLNAHIQTDAEDPFEKNGGLLCYIKEITRFFDNLGFEIENLILIKANISYFLLSC